MKILKFLIALLLLTSCGFEFEKDFVNEKIQVVDSDFNIRLSNFTEGSVLREPTTVLFNGANQANERLIEIKFFVDDVPVFQTDQLTGEFIIDTDLYEEGSHKLEVVYAFFSGSGSLADLSNQEGFIARNEYNFTVNKSLRAPIDVIGVKNENGSVYVYWDNTDVTGVFDEAILLMKYETVKGQLIEIERPLTKTDLKTGFFNDIGLINGKTTYSIILSNRYKTNEGASQTYEVADNFNLEVIYINENRYKFKWNRHELYGNFTHYKWYGYGLRNDNNSIFSSQGGEMEVEGQLIFGADYSLVLLPESREYRHDSNREISLTLGKYFTERVKGYGSENIQDALYSQISNSYFFLHFTTYSSSHPDMSLLEFDANDFSFKRSKRIKNTKAFSNIEDKLILDPNTGNLIIDLRSEITVIDPISLNVIKEFTPTEFGIDSYIPKISYRNNKIFIDEFKFNLKIFNAETKEKILDIYSSNWRLSDNGKYLLTNDKIYEIKDNTVTLIKYLGGGGKVSIADFSKDGEKLYYSWEESGVWEYNLLTNTSRNLNIDGQIHLIEFDDISNKILVHKNLYNSNSQELSIYTQNGSELFTTTANAAFKGLYTFLNDKLFSLKEGIVLENHF